MGLLLFELVVEYSEISESDELFNALSLLSLAALDFSCKNV